MPELFVSTQDWHDTFLDYEHLKESFCEYKLEFDRSKYADEASLRAPFKLTFPKPASTSGKTPAPAAWALERAIQVEPYTPIVEQGYGSRKGSSARRNAVRFTPVQVEGIRSGLQPGLTLIVGPPGSGKTDVAVQIVSNLYRNYPEQRTLIVTHSNQVCNMLAYNNNQHFYYTRTNTSFWVFLCTSNSGISIYSPLVYRL